MDKSTKVLVVGAHSLVRGTDSKEGSGQFLLTPLSSFQGTLQSTLPTYQLLKVEAMFRLAEETKAWTGH
jgi:hypothetical protein